MEKKASVDTELLALDKAARNQSLESLRETIRQLREMAEYLADLAAQPLEGQPSTLH